MVGGKNGHERVAVFATQMNCGEADCGGGVASDRLGEYVRFRDAWKLFANLGGLVFVGDDPKICGTESWRQARGGLFNIVSAPMMLRSCFGVRVRLRGQKRVPRPPARMTAYA
jgi:hypothetical protein